MLSPHTPANLHSLEALVVLILRLPIDHPAVAAVLHLLDPQRAAIEATLSRELALTHDQCRNSLRSGYLVVHLVTWNQFVTLGPDPALPDAIRDVCRLFDIPHFF